MASTSLVVYNAQRQPVNLGAQVGRGGEAAVYRLAVQPALLAKIYHAQPRPEYGAKLAWMVANPPDDPTRPQGHASIAWPSDLLYDQAGTLRGYVMVNVHNAVPVLQVFNPRLRAKTLPNFNRRYLHRTARNLAAALGALHASRYVVGDLNESNVMVTPSALVTVIDADSFQVQGRNGSRPVLYPCPVGKPEYTAPELQGKTFAQTARQPEHDRFGLAVLIFQLLMEGNHPFRAQWLGSGEPSPLEDRIRDGLWPYAGQGNAPVAPPRLSLPLNALHPALSALAHQCFVDGHRDPRRRPSPEEWERALITAEKALAPCRHGHIYSRHLRQCPECELRAAVAAAQAAAQAAHSGTRAAPASGSSPASRPRPMPRPAPPMGQGGPAVGVWPPAVRWPFPWPLRGRGASPAAPAVVMCRRCGRANSADEIYCQACARRLAGRKVCGQCQRKIPANARYCPKCGRRQ